jgi:hypothetical protein
MISTLIAVGSGTGNSVAFQESRTGERDRTTSADLSAQRNFEGGLLSKAYADRANMGRRNSAVAGSRGIINSG